MTLMRSIFSVLLLLLAFTALAFAQDVPPGMREISGAKNPELIPEDQALGALFSRVGDGKGVSSWESRVFFLRESGISEQKAGLIIHQANRYLAEFTSAQERMSELKRKKPPPAEVKDLFEKDSTELKKLWADVKDKICTGLGSADYEKLKAFLDRRIKPDLTLVVPE